MMQLMQVWTQHLPGMAEVAVRSAVLLAMAAVVVRCLQRSSAATRHLVWSSAVMGVLLLPVATGLIPVELELPIVFEEEAPIEPQWIGPPTATLSGATMVATASPFELLQNDVAPTPVDLQRAETSTSRKRGRISGRTAADTPAERGPHFWGILCGIVWGVGAVCCLIPVVVGRLSLSRMQACAIPFPQELAVELQSLSRRHAGLTVRGVLSERRHVPMTWGIWQPVVLLPIEAVDWTPTRRRLVLLHELAHVKRFDYLTQLMGQLCRALHWYNPLAWLALYEMRVEQERASDDVVLNSGEVASDYAHELLSITAALPQSYWDSAVALAMSRATRLEQRLNSILDQDCNRRAVSRRAWAGWSMLLVSAVVTLAILQPVSIQNVSEAAEAPQSAPSTTVAREKLSAATQSAATGEEQPVDVPQADQTPQAPAPSPAATPDSAPAATQAQAPVASDDTPANLQSVLELISENAVNPTDPKVLSDAAIRGMFEALRDPYATFIPHDQMQKLQQQLKGQLVGIGTVLKKSASGIVVQMILPQSPAMTGGLKVGDEILNVDGEVIQDLEKAVTTIRGPSGSQASIKVRRNGEELKLTFQRAELKLPAVKGLAPEADGTWQYWLDQERKIGYVQIVEFNRTTGVEMRHSIETLQKQGMRGLVLDLRANPGGLLNACLEVAQLFMKGATVVSISGRNSSGEQVLKTGAEAICPDVPLVVVVDRHTASAAEVLAAALKENGRAEVVGERTFGKGSVQAIIPMTKSGSAMRLTIAQMFSPKGQALNRQPGKTVWGVEPDEGQYVPMTSAERALRIDRQFRRLSSTAKLPPVISLEFVRQDWADNVLAAALEALGGKLASGEFKKAGRPLADLQATLQQQEELRQQRDEFRRKLEQLNHELGE